MVTSLGIPLVITGFSEGQREMDHQYKILNIEEHKSKFIKAFYTWKSYFQNVANFYPKEESDQLMKTFFPKLESYINESNAHYPYFLPLSNYVQWNSMSDLESILQENTNWTRPANTVSHSSCFIEPIKGYMENKRNLNELRSEISCMIRNGSISREEASLEMEKMCIVGDKKPDVLDQFYSFINISEEQFMKSTLSRPIQKKFDIFLIRSVQKELIFFSVCHLTH